jgi:acetyl esterase/lipase
MSQTVIATVSYPDLVYARRPERFLRLDLRVPRGVIKPPLILYIPMGGMRGCNKTHGAWWLTEAGFAVASIECRVSSEAIAPAAVHDCKAAIRWLRAQAPAFGYDGERLGVHGHSAGGLLASLMATSGDAPAIEDPQGTPGVSSRVQAACDECGAPHDLAYFARPEVKALYAPVDENIRLYLGAPVEQRLELARLVSPSTYISRKTPPILLIHGDADTVVPASETAAFHQALLAAGVASTLWLLPGIGHGWPASLTRDRIVAFFRRTLA